jgi:hypothetical protein
MWVLESGDSTRPFVSGGSVTAVEAGRVVSIALCGYAVGLEDTVIVVCRPVMVVWGLNEVRTSWGM